MPARVVAPISVKGGRLSFITRALGPWPKHDIQMKVFERGVEGFLYHAVQPVNLINKKNVPGAQIGENRGEVARLFKGGAARGDDIHTELARHNIREGCFAKSGWAAEQSVVDRFSALLGGSEKNLEFVFQLGLPNEIVQALRAAGNSRR